MSRILKRPMFRKGGEVMEGVMTGIKPRENFATKGMSDDMITNVRGKIDLIDAIAGGRQDNLSNLLISGGMNLLTGENEGDNVLQTLAGAYKKPTQQLFATQAADTKGRRAIAASLISKMGTGDASKAWKEYGKYTGLSEEAFYKQYGRSKLYKDEPTPQMKQARLKGDFVKNLTRKKNFLQESDVDSNEAAQIFEGYQSLVNGNKDLAKQVDSGQLYVPKSAESFEKVKGGFVPNDTDGMRTNKIYFDFNNLMGQGQTWFLFDGTKLVPKARVD